MRVALIPSAYPPNVGGVEELTRHLALSLVAAGCAVEVWTQQIDDGSWPAVEVLDGITVRRFLFPMPRSEASSLLPFGRGGAATLAAMRKAVAEFRPDVLHVQCFGPNGAYATALSTLCRIPLVVTLQGETVMDDQDLFDISSTMKTALRLGIKKAAAVTGCSDFTLRDARARFGLGVDRGKVIFNGVSLEQPRAGTFTFEGRYILALGRMVEKKGFDLLISAWARIAADHPDVRLAIGGSGAAQGSLLGLIDSLDVSERVRLVGRLDRAEVAAAMAGADVFVMPSRLEPFGIVVLEGWRAGRPVIATTIGGPPEFVRDGEDGLLVDPFDTDAFAAVLDKVLSDEALRSSLGAASLERVREFAWPVIARSYSDLYESVTRR